MRRLKRNCSNDSHVSTNGLGLRLQASLRPSFVVHNITHGASALTQYQ